MEEERQSCVGDKGCLVVDSGGITSKPLAVYTRRGLDWKVKMYNNNGKSTSTCVLPEGMGGKTQVEYLCTLCSKSCNGINQVRHHNGGKAHRALLKECGYLLEHGLRDFIKEIQVGENVKEVQVCETMERKESISQCVIYREHDAQMLIHDLRAKGEEVPDRVKIVVKVKKVLDYNSFDGVFDFEAFLVRSQEIGGSFVLLDGDVVLGIHVAHCIPPDMATVLCQDALKLFHNGGCVERSKDKHASPMTMFGFRIAQMFERYAHPLDKRQKLCGPTMTNGAVKCNRANKTKAAMKSRAAIKIKEAVRIEKAVGCEEEPNAEEASAKAAELELFGDIFVEKMYSYISEVFPEKTKLLCDLYDCDRGLGRMGTTPFSGLGISKDYSSFPHVDKDDYKYSFISWFLDRREYFANGLCAGGEFILPEYGVYFQPRHGAVFVLNSKMVCHGTRRNVGFTQVGVVNFTKLKLVNAGKKRASLIGLE